MSAHAILSPSGAHRWMQCPGSVVLERGKSDASSEHAAEGTAAHQVAAWCLTENKPASAYVGRVVQVGDREIEVTDDMAEHVQTYVDRVCDYAQGNQLFVEVAVPISDFTGEQDATGTSDAVIITTDEIQVHDLKYGRGVKVDADENEQLMIYALGALQDYNYLTDAQRVRLVIHQPRLDHLSEWVLPVEELQAFSVNVMNSAQRVTAARTKHATLGSNAFAQTYLNPGDSQCRFCKAKATCPALAAKVQEVVGAEFDDLTIADAKPSVPASTTELSAAMRAVDMVESWCKAVRAETERVLLAGGVVNGYKLVEGRKGARSWKDEQQVETILRKQFRLKVEEAYTMKLISPTQAEKLLKTNPGRWEKLQAHIAQSQGQPSVAPESDKRPAWSPESALNDFEVLV